jgi:hypothetical protein
VRPWLVVVGVIFLTLAVGTGATIYFAGQGNPSRSTVHSGPQTLLVGPSETETLSLPGTNGSSEQFSFSWGSTSPVAVILESPAGCASSSGPCWSASTFAIWKSNTSGIWTGSGPFHYPLECVLQNSHSDPTNVTTRSSATAMNPTHLPLLIDIVLGAGAAGLFVVGGLAVFLGLFLRGDPFGPEAPILSRSADDLEETFREPPPDH